MLFYHALYQDVSCTDWFRVMLHGLPLDLSLAGYLTVIPGLLLLVSAWTLSNGLRRIGRVYFLVVSILLSLVFVVDLGLYEYWGFRLDATPLFYFFSSPKDALASGTAWMAIGALVVIVLYAVLLYGVFYAVLLRKSYFERMKLPYFRLRVSGVLLVLTALLFIPIRGGFGVAAMNTGKVYFSTNQRLNHATINPLFSLMESLSKQRDFCSQYRFMDNEEANRIFSGLQDAVFDGKSAMSTALHPLFTTDRPNIIFVVLESFSSTLMETLGGQSGVAVHLDSLAQEGILFTNFYANSFRTDRGLVSILSGYPAQPTTSIMKYPRKSQSLPAIAGSLKRAGYRTKYYYGGDADFTNMRSYLKSSGFEEIVCDADFPIWERQSKWGAHDHVVFKKLLDDLRAEAEEAEHADSGQEQSESACPADSIRHFRVLQTSSSHEPFQVPYHRLKDKYMNAFAYTDSCVGDFVQQFRELPQWENTLILFVPDHLGGNTDLIDNFALYRYQIPLLLVGGAVRQPMRIDVYGSQQDIAATLLAQLHLPHHDFVFSKDMLNPASPHFAFFTVPDAFGFVDEDNQLIYNNESGQIVLDEGWEKGKNLRLGQAYLQKLYDDIACR